ncbi:MAG: clostripain-related cysteine peptidase [Elusimicrobiales bacterium]|nr:clostripain-related cysteine peptidase [Elusimicrobiales bacterium]
MKKTTALMLALFMQTGSSAVLAAPVSLEFGDSVYSIDTSVVPTLAAPAGLPDRGAAKPAKKKKWTVMVFINGKNDLETAGLLNVNMMEMVGSDKNMNVVVEIGRMKGQAGDTDADGDWTGSRRLYVTKDNDQEKITSRVVMTTPQVDMGDYQRAVDFVKWSKKFYPAERYMLVLWDHGTGWMDPRKEEPAAAEGDNKGISFDDETGNYIRTPQIGTILKESGGADILAFDACLMQMAEVASEVKGHARVMVGSEETTPGVGIPYHALLAVMAGNPGMNSEELGAVLAELFVRFYKEMGKGVQNSAIRLEKMPAFEKLMKDFAALAREVGDAGALKTARAGVMRYEVLGRQSDPAKTISFYGDVYNYAELLASTMTATGPAADALKAKAGELKLFIKNELVIHNNYTGADHAGRDFKDSHGISVYLPPAETRVAQEKLEGIFEDGYAGFAFAKAAGWHDFVTYLYGIE